MLSSPLFWVIALALLVATLATLLWPLLRRAAGTDAPADRSAATAVFRDHKRQIEDDFATRAIGAEERDAALADLAARFGQELTQEAPLVHAASDRPRWIAALVLVACLPVVAGLTYFTIGNPEAMTATASAPAHGGEQGTNDAQTVTMVAALAQRLQANPEDGEGWALLGRSYRALGRFDAAALAYGEAVKRLPPNASLYADWAEAIAQAQGKSLVGQPTELLDRALAVDPVHPKALALRGSAAMERDDPATAVTMWKRLRATLPADSPDIAQVDAVLARIGEKPAVPAPQAAVPAPPATAPVAPGPGAPAATAAAPAAGGSVEGRVELDPKLVASAKPGDVVFIFARDPDGSRMPLAAMKIAVADLPKSFALTDAMAMTPAATISKAAKVVVEARVSKSGNVVAQSGDLTGTSAPVAPGTRNLHVTIDRVVP
ncbi:MAG: c-type cytochrome biogenesis protein CcmI [Betaproteobacteria bacterium]